VRIEIFYFLLEVQISTKSRMNSKRISFVLTILILAVVESKSVNEIVEINKLTGVLKYNIKNLDKMDVEQRKATVLFLKYLTIISKIFSKEFTKEQTLMQLLPIHDELLNAFNESKYSQRMRNLLLKLIKNIWNSKEFKTRSQ
jgi:hypothetical protein